MAEIPIYHQQIEPPRPPSLRQQVSPEAARAATMGQFGGRLQQVGTAFAGRLFDLAAKNEIDDALITAREQWQDFARKLKTDPEYTAYSEKFQSFYTGLRDTIWSKLRMPKAKTDLENRLETLRVDWQDQIQRYSDDRAIDHAFTVMVKGLNQDIVNQDQASVNQRISEAVAAGVVAEKDGEHFRQMSNVQIYANNIGFPDSVLWLSTEEPTIKYGISREERLSLLGQYKTEWGLLRNQEQQAMTAEIEQTELDFMDRLQQGDPPSWNEIRDSELPRERKEHYQGLINRISEQARKGEEARIEAQRKELELIQKEKKSAAYLQAYKELVDYPLNQEERWEDRIIGDPLLENKEKEHFIDEYRQRAKSAQDAAKQKSPLETTDDSILAELIRRFYDSDISNDAVKSFIQSKHGMGLSNSDSKTWLDKLKTREPYKVHNLAVTMVKQYFDDSLKAELSELKILSSRKTEALIIKQIADEAAKGKLTEDGLLQFASNLLVEPKRQRVNGIFSRFETEMEFEKRVEPEAKAPAPVEVYDQEMVDRFTQWKGAPPVATSDSFQGTYLEIAFFDGKWWYVNRRGSWYRWDTNRWRMVVK